MRKITTLIVDDESPARQWLRTLCARHSDVQLCGECSTAADAIQRVRTLQPQLLLLDIQLGPSSGFRVLENVPAAQMPLVVLVTAFDEYAVQAFETNALDYLLKPVPEERFAAALRRVRQRLHAGLTAELRAEVRGALEPLQRLFGQHATHGTMRRLFVQRENRLHAMDVERIDLLESNGNYVVAHCGEQRYTTRATLQSMEELLGSGTFLRVSKSAIVNLNSVSYLERDDTGGYCFVMQSGRRVMTGRTYRHAIAQLVRTQALLGTPPSPLLARG